MLKEDHHSKKFYYKQKRIKQKRVIKEPSFYGERVNRPKHRKNTNSTSRFILRLINKAELKDIVKYKITDSLAIGKSCRKTMSSFVPWCISNQSIPVVTKPIIKFVHLESIHKNLYISNVNYLPKEDFGLVINLSGLSNVNSYSYKLEPTTFKDFAKVL